MAVYSDVTRESVIKAVREYDRKGEARFLEEYGYGRARAYFLVVDGKDYPSKAILLAACRYELDLAEALQHDAFSGGRQTVARHLEKLGFKVRYDPPGTPEVFVL